MELIDFTDCRITNKTYGGANGSKLSGIYNNEMYMIKLPSVAKAFSFMHYSNSCYSEYLGCHIFNHLEVTAQETLLGIYRKNGKTYNVVACKDFATGDLEFQDFASLKNQIIDSGQHGYGTELESILFTIKEQNLVDGDKLVSFFWDMFIIDALIGNFDRHNGNWGFLRNRKTDEVSIAPVFDCGSSLNSQASEEDMKTIMSDINQLKIRVYDRPVSAIQVKNKKIRYFDFLKETENRDCIKSLKKINEKIDFGIIDGMIESVPFFSDTMKEFYRFILSKRKEMILENALGKKTC